MVNRAFDKIRQAARGMPAVFIRLLDSLDAVVDATTSSSQREALLRQGEMVLTSSQESVSDRNDLYDIEQHFKRLSESISSRDAPSASH